MRASYTGPFDPLAGCQQALWLPKSSHRIRHSDCDMAQRTSPRRTGHRRPHSIPDFRGEVIEESAREDPTFPQMVEATFDQRRLMRELTSARLAADLSQTRLAAVAGMSQSQIARAESGDVDDRLSTVARMAAVLGKRLEWTLVDTT